MTSALPTVSPRQATAFILRRQGFIDHRLAPLEVVRRLVAVQSQYLASVPVAVWTRQPNTPYPWADQAQYEDKSLVRVWCLRGTVHTLASVDLPLFVARQLEKKDYWFLRYLTSQGVGDAELKRRNKKIMAALKKGPVSRHRLHEMIPELQELKGAGYGIDVRALTFTGDVVFAGVEGNHPRFARRDLWLPDLKWRVPSVKAANHELLLRYFVAYGPATLKDFAYWTGMKASEAKAIFTANQAELAEVAVTGWPAGQLVRAADIDELLNSPEDLPPVMLVPKFDNLLLAWRDKGRVIDEHGYKHIYRKAAQVDAAVFIDGRIQAGWRIKPGKTLAVSLNAWGKRTKRVQKQVAAKFDEYARWTGADGARIEYVDGFG